MKYVALLSLAFLVTGCEQIADFSLRMREGDTQTVCEKHMQPELCTLIVGCGEMPNMQVCEMQTRQMCQGPIDKSTSSDIFKCAQALHRMSCDDSLPQECMDLD